MILNSSQVAPRPLLLSSPAVRLPGRYCSHLFPVATLLKAHDGTLTPAVQCCPTIAWSDVDSFDELVCGVKYTVLDPGSFSFRRLGANQVLWGKRSLL